jgi:hypothetical protein
VRVELSGGGAGQGIVIVEVRIGLQAANKRALPIRIDDYANDLARLVAFDEISCSSEACPAA